MKEPNFVNPLWINSKIEPGEFFVVFTRRLSELMSSTKAGDTITIFINSQGGDTITTLAVYDLLKSCNRHTVGVVAGAAHSGASLALQACKVRLMTRNSSLMLHKSTVKVDGFIANCQEAIRRFQRMDETFFRIYAERSGKEKSDITEIANVDTYFDAHEAIQAGLIDAVLE